jgi:hypothetical protein
MIERLKGMVRNMRRLARLAVSSLSLSLSFAVEGSVHGLEDDSPSSTGGVIVVVLVLATGAEKTLISFWGTGGASWV